jgi:hypothetical protein
VEKLRILAGKGGCAAACGKCAFLWGDLLVLSVGKLWGRFWPIDYLRLGIETRKTASLSRKKSTFRAGS